MTGLRKSGRGGVDAPDGDPSPRASSSLPKSTITDRRMTPCHKAVSIAKNRPNAEAVISSSANSRLQFFHCSPPGVMTIGGEAGPPPLRAACIQGGGAVEWPAWGKIPDRRIGGGGHGFCRSRPPPRLRLPHFCCLWRAASPRLRKSTPLAGSSNCSSQIRRRNAP